MSEKRKTNSCSVADVGAYTYGLGHPMKPHRIRVTHDLVSAYDMLDKMHILVRLLLLFLVLPEENSTWHCRDRNVQPPKQ